MIDCALMPIPDAARQHIEREISTLKLEASELRARAAFVQWKAELLEAGLAAPASANMVAEGCPLL